MARKRPAGGAAKSSPRAARNTLSRARIVDAALELVDRGGMSALTMPRLASSLGVGTMSLYRHVDDKDDLVNAVAERVFSRVSVPPGDADDWEDRVVGYLRNLRAEALAHPALSGILSERGLPLGPIFDELEEVQGILRAAGFPDLDAVRSCYALFTYVLGFIVWELPRVHQQPAADYVAAWDHALNRLDPERYPNLFALREPLTSVASADQFEYGLQHLVDSLRADRRLEVPGPPVPAERDQPGARGTASRRTMDRGSRSRRSSD